MGVEYARWLIARGNGFSPGAPAIMKLVDLLREDRWIPKAGGRGAAVRTVENTFGNDAAKKAAASTEALPEPLTKDWLDDPEREELRLVWTIDAAEPFALQVPITHHPDGPGSYAIEIHRSAEYVVPSADTIGALPTTCNCGEDLSFEWDDEELVPAFRRSTGIFAECEDCSRTFDPSKGTAAIENPFGGAPLEVRGGAAYRFAIKVDCGTWFEREPQIAIAPALVALVEKHFGREFYQVGALF